jgi:outer membrane lipoprotein SlyB
MKKVLLLVAVVATLGLVSCNNAQVQAEKARQDSLIEAARLDSIAKVQADSIQAAIEAAEAAALAAAADSLVEVVE